ncbi:MAG TPA: hypothetical protein VK209_06010 [Candidatus Sulfotelmatobacter sp.]|nr:hypothetical protein [Candidatus Sulfotelmatobacter sp.]
MTEHALHSEIKRVYSLPGDIFEAKLDNYIIDILRDKLIIEIQTRNFSAIKEKLHALIKTHQVRLVYPISENKWITYITKDGTTINKRKSPRRGKLTDLFRELVRIPDMLRMTNFSLEVLFIDEEEIRCNDGKGTWKRRGVSIKGRRLIKVNDRLLFQNKQDYLKIVPNNLNEFFTNKELAKSIKIPVWIARQITYCLRKSDIIRINRNKGRELLFQRVH